MAEINLDSKEVDDTLKEDGKDQGRLQLRQENENEKKSNLQKYAENNSVGGLLYVLSSKSKIRRLIWLIIILVCVAISLYLVRNTFSKLLNPPTSTTITNEPNLSLEFPAVTICNVNAFSAEILEIYGVSPELVKDFYRSSDLIPSETKLELLTHNFIDRFIRICKFGNQFCDIDEDFESVSLNGLFACYTFNSGRSGKPIHKTSITGASNGLTLTIDINQSDYSETTNFDAGIKILIHPQDEPPHPDRFGVAASPGTNMYIGFKKQVYDDQTMRSCSPKGQHKWMYLSEEIPYSYASCLKDSLINTSINENVCGCVLTTDFLSKDEQYPLCTYNDLQCYLDFAKWFDPPEPCKPACKHTTFEILSATHTTYPANQYVNTKVFQDHMFYFKLSSDLTVINVYYETLNVQTQTTVYSYGIEEFFAEVGGQLGLFIGVSVITLFEFVIFLGDELKNWIKKRLRNSKISK